MKPLWKTVRIFLRKLKMELPFEPTIPLLGLYPKNSETPILKNICRTEYLCPSKSYVEVLTPNVAVYADKVSKEMTKVK